MLTSDLLATRIHKGKIEPVYATLDKENIDISGSVIDLFQKHIGKTYGELNEEIEGIEEIDYRLIRGLAQMLERRCVSGMNTVIEPATARRTVFEDCKGAVSDGKERKDVMDKVARKLSVEPCALEKALWADMEENLVIKEFQTITPENLLRQYNLSLTQTLLFKATGMEIQIEDNYQHVFRKIKQLGLMYSIQDGKIYLDGVKITYLDVSKQTAGTQQIPEGGEPLYPIQWKPPIEQKESLIYTCPECLTEIDDKTLEEWGMR